MDSSPSNQSGKGVMEKEKGCGKLKLYQAMELCVLMIITLLVWGGLTLPTVFYFTKNTADIVGQPSLEEFITSLNVSSNSGASMLPPVNPFASVNCTEGFYKDANGYCFAECGQWQPFQRTTQLTSDVFSILAISTGILTAVAVFIVSIIKHKKFFKFPAVFIIYSTLSATTFDVFVLIGYMNRPLFFCNSQSVTESYTKSTTFCSFVGVITWYMVLQIFFWWLSHVATLFINVKFPVVARSIRKSNRTFIPHIATVTLAVFLPLGTIIAAFPTGGFTNFHTIPPLCSPQNVELLYYGCVLPIGIILALGTPMLASTLWIIIKQHRKLKTPGKMMYRPGTPEVKVAILLSYHMSVATVYLVAFSVDLYTLDNYIAELRLYFVCELWGFLECSRQSFEQFKVPIAYVVGVILIWIFPMVNLVYVISVKNIMETYSKRTSKALFTSNGQLQTRRDSSAHNGSHILSVTNSQDGTAL